MSDALNVFITESNVEALLTKVYECLDASERDVLLRLVVEEESRMGNRREHMVNGQRRVNDCRDRIMRQRDVVGAMDGAHPRATQARLLLETLERTLRLMEDHQRLLVQQFERSRL